jgi:alpha-N-arabinofuranosidase
METRTPITVGEEAGEVRETIYGQFIEHILTCINGGVYDPDSPFADETGVRTDVLEKAKELHPPILRFPGGTVMCQYHWEDAVGPKENRIIRKNLIWGGELDPSFGTAEFVDYCRRIGAEPMICINMVSGTPEEAGNWVEYCNGTGHSYYAQLRRSHGYPEPFQVKYWCIGNESYAEPDPGIHHDVSLYIRDALEYIKVMKLTDPTIKTVLVGCDRLEWNKAVLDKLHPFGDYLSLHHYSSENGKGIYGPFEGEKALIQMIEEAEGLIDTHPDKVENFSPWYRFPPREGKMKIALDEWNIWNFAADETYGLLPTYNWRDALWVASALAVILTHPSVEIANMAQLVNVIAPIIAHPAGAYYQTIAYPFLLFRQNMVGKRVVLHWNPVSFEGGEVGNLEALRCCAVCTEEGELRVVLINRDFSLPYTVCLGSGQASALVMTADSPEAVCSKDSCCVRQEQRTVDTEEILLPPGSITLLSKVRIKK